MGEEIDTLLRGCANCMDFIGQFHGYKELRSRYVLEET